MRPDRVVGDNDPCRVGRVRDQRKPNNPGLPDWPRYDPATRSTMLFDETCRVEETTRRRRERALGNVL